ERRLVLDVRRVGEVGLVIEGEMPVAIVPPGDGERAGERKERQLFGGDVLHHRRPGKAAAPGEDAEVLRPLGLEPVGTAVADELRLAARPEARRDRARVRKTEAPPFTASLRLAAPPAGKEDAAPDWSGSGVDDAGHHGLRRP